MNFGQSCRYAKGIMSKMKDPPGYPGDEAILKGLGETVRNLRLKQGLSIERVNALVDEGIRQNAHPFLPRALAIVVRQLREDRNMSRAQLSNASGLPLNLINRLERGRARRVTMTQIFRLAFAMNHGVGDFVEKVEDCEKQLQSASGYGQ
jgi:DNA-binding Xre family transcriptional regulator